MYVYDSRALKKGKWEALALDKYYLFVYIYFPLF